MRGGITRANFEKIKEKFLRDLSWEDGVEMWMDLKKVFTEADKKKLNSTIVTSDKFGQIPVDDWVEKMYNKIGSEIEILRKDRKPITTDIKKQVKELMYVLREVVRYTTDKEEGEEDEDEFIWNKSEEGEEEEDEEDEDEDEEEEDNYDGIIKIFNIYEGDEEEEEEEEDEDEEERVSFPPQQSRFGSGLRRRKFVDRTVYFPG
jgi:hypothetical protein